MLSVVLPTRPTLTKTKSSAKKSFARARTAFGKVALNMSVWRGTLISLSPSDRFTVFRNISQDLANLRLETHIKHPVGLVKNKITEIRLPFEWKIPNTIKTNFISHHAIQETSRSSNKDITALTQLVSLRTPFGTSVKHAKYCQILRIRKRYQGLNILL